jgi:L-2,4-diaminobutyrate decarboxylase
MESLLKKAYDPAIFRQQGHALIDLLADHLTDSQSGNLEQAIPWQTPDAALAYWENDFQTPTNTDPLPLWTETIARSVRLHHPRYMGHQVSPVLPMAALSGLVKQMLNNGMAVFEMGMVANPHERIVMEWLAQKIGFAKQAGGIITSGGTLANLTALLTARAKKAPSDVWEHGVQEKLAVIVSEEAHYCIDRAARIMGLGSEGIIKIPVNAQFQLKTELLETAFEQAQAKGYQVIAVIGSACSTSTGAYEDLNTIADFCEKHQLWFHVDGAHGGAAVVSKKYRHLVSGIERADSVIIDFHKMMMIPALATAVVYKNGSDAFQTFHQKAQYLWDNQQSEDWFNSGKRTFECTKGMMSTMVYSVLRTYGEQIFEENVDVLYDLGRQFAQMVQAQPHFELATLPESNIVCFRYVPAAGEDINLLNAKIRQQLLEEGVFYIVQTQLNGQLYLRVSLMNPLTALQDVEDLLQRVEEIGNYVSTLKIPEGNVYL